MAREEILFEEEIKEAVKAEVTEIIINMLNAGMSMEEIFNITSGATDVFAITLDYIKEIKMSLLIEKIRNEKDIEKVRELINESTKETFMESAKATVGNIVANMLNTGMTEEYITTAISGITFVYDVVPEDIKDMCKTL